MQDQASGRSKRGLTHERGLTREQELAGRHLADKLGADDVERFGSGFSIERALEHLKGGETSVFDDGVVWDAVTFEHEEEARALSKLLVGHGIRCATHHGTLVFKQSDVCDILRDLGYAEGIPAESDTPVDRSDDALAAGSNAAETASAKAAGTIPAGGDSSDASDAVVPDIDDDVLGRSSYFHRDEGAAARDRSPKARRMAAEAREERRREALSEDIDALRHLREGAEATSSAEPRPALSESERADLLEHLARISGERSIPTLSSPLRIPEAFGHLLGFEDPVPPKSFAERVFRICMQLLLIYAICLAGEKVSQLIPIGVPGNILSMLLLLAFLLSGVIRMESISLAADFLLDHMAVFFVPAAVAIMGNFDLIAPNLVKLLLVCLITTVLVFFVTSFTVSTVMNLMAKRGHGMAAPAAAPSAPSPASSDKKEG